MVLVERFYKGLRKLELAELLAESREEQPDSTSESAARGSDLENRLQGGWGWSIGLSFCGDRPLINLDGACSNL